MTRRRAALLCVRSEAVLLPRRLARFLPLLALLVLCALAALGAVTSGAQDKRAPLRLAVADKEDSFLSRTAVAAIANNSEIAALFTVESCDEQAAIDGIKNGDFSAAMIFEKDFITGILDGDETAVRIILSDALRRNGEIVRHTAKTGEILMKTAEYAVNVAWEPLRDAMPYNEAARAMNRLELACALEFLALPLAAFSAETLPYSANRLALIPHYVLCFAVLLLYLAETVFAKDVRQACAYGLLCRVRGLGVGSGAFLLGKTVFPFLLRLLLLLVLCLVGRRTVDVTPTAAAIGCALLAVLFSSIFLTALSVVFLGSPLGAAVPAAIGTVGLFLCGGLLPLHLLPRRVAVLGALTPFGAAADLLAPLFGGICAPRAYLLAAAYTAVAVLLAFRRLRAVCQNGGLTV